MRAFPFPHYVVDDFITPELCRAACVEWPDETWPHWLKYEGERGTKYVTKDPSRLTPTCSEICREMSRVPVERLLGIPGTFPDVTLYGAGMSMIPAGGDLPLHLDSDHHPVTRWQRALSAMVYLSDCEGGEFRLWDASGKKLETCIEAKPGRLVLFECSSTAWHSVAPVTAGKRLSLSLFFWRLATANDVQRPRAQFATIDPQDRIEVLGMNNRVKNVLKSAGVQSITSLLQWTVDDLLELRGIGCTYLCKLQVALQQNRGVQLKRRGG